MRRTAALLAALLGLSSLAAVAAPAAAATTDLVINEVESDGDTTDWVELYNPTGAAIDAGGLRLTDDNPSRTFTIPASTTVPAGGFLAVDVSVGTGSFGLGNGDEVHVWDGDVEVDSFVYGEHAATTWGACPDGSNDFVVTLEPTKGAANACDPVAADVVVINEVESSGGTPGDWVELMNTATVAVDVSGLVIKDSDDGHAWVIPADTSIAAGGFAAFDVESGSSGFGLGGGDSARLFDTDATTLIDEYTWTSHATTSYGRCPDGSGDFATTATTTKAAANDCPLPEGADDIAINELQSDDPVTSDWVELVNLGDAAVDISGWVVADSGSTSALPTETVVPAGGYLVLENGVHFDFGLGNGDEFHLYLADGVSVVDEIAYEAHPTAPGTWGRCPDGTGDLALTAEATRGAANSCAIDPAAAVVINEIESSPASGSDWVELTNTSLLTVDVSGYLLKDSGEGNTITIPADTTIAAGGFVAIDVTGLGGADSARFAAPDGTVIDEYSWAAHADETFGRCPDGIGAFADTDAATRGAANDCPAPAGFEDVVINEVESSGGSPADWVELYNAGEAAVDLSGWIVHDSEDDHTVVIPGGTTIEPQGFVVIVTDVPGGFGLGNDDRVRLFLPDDATLVDERIWGPEHAATTFGLCPDGTGDFVETFSSTKGAPNDCSPVRINEVESSGGVPGDWIELVNAGESPVDVSGWQLKDSDDSHVVTLPAATVLAAGAYLAVDTEPAFGLGGGDSARLFDAGGTLLDSYSWTEHAATTYARCPDAVGPFAASTESTRGALNSCAGIVPAMPWPGGTDVATVDATGFFGEDMSGLAYEGTGTAERGILWAVNNGTGTLFRLQWTGSTWAPAAGEWTAGKALRYPDGTGTVDAEGVGLTAAGSLDGVYVASERNNDASGVSRPSVLRYDVSASGATLTASHEWNLSGILPAMGNNSGLEGIAWIPDAFLTERGFVDESTGLAYDPAAYPNHGSGLFFVGVEATAEVYAVALSTTGESALVATIDPGLAVVAEVAFDADESLLWAVCDDACEGKTVTLEIAQEGPFAGSFQVTDAYAAPAGMDSSIANEGFAIAGQELCVDDAKPVFYADDNGIAGHSLRESTLDCVSATDPTDPVEPPAEDDLTGETQNLVTGPKSAAAGDTIVVTVGAGFAGQEVDGWIFSEPTHLGTRTVGDAGTVSFLLPSDLTPGAHRIAVTDADGELIGWFGIQITAAALASTGSAPAPIAPVAALLLALGGLAVLVARRRASA